MWLRKTHPLPLPAGVRSRSKGLFAALSVAAAQEAVHQLQRVGIVGEIVQIQHTIPVVAGDVHLQGAVAGYPTGWSLITRPWATSC